MDLDIHESRELHEHDAGDQYGQETPSLGFVELKGQDIHIIRHFMNRRHDIHDDQSRDHAHRAVDEDIVMGVDGRRGYGDFLDDSEFTDDDDMTIHEALVAPYLRRTRQLAQRSANSIDNDEMADILDIPDIDQPPVAPRIYECPCTESSTNIENFFQLQCGCVRCPDCLITNINVGIESRKDFPPRCQDCDLHIEFAHVESVLEEGSKTKWQQIRTEYDDISPVYCATPDCNIYIPRTSMLEDRTGKKWAHCAACDAQTCTECSVLKSKHMPGSTACPEAVEASSLEEMRAKGYKPCPWCKQMIERIEGCDHMSCETCGRNFCYNCGRKKGRIELPCNCQGGNDWVEEDLDQFDPEAQQDILDRVLGGMQMPAGGVRDLELMGFGRFGGIGRRVGEDDNEEEEQGNRNEGEAVQGQGARVDDGFNHWNAQQVDRRDRLFFRHRLFRGEGHRLGEDNDGNPNGDHNAVDGAGGSQAGELLEEYEDLIGSADDEEEEDYRRRRGMFPGGGNRVGAAAQRRDPVLPQIPENDAFNHHEALYGVRGHQPRRFNPYGRFRGQGQRLGD